MHPCLIEALICVTCLWDCIFCLHVFSVYKHWEEVCMISPANCTHCAHSYTLSPSVCIMFLAWPLFLFAGRAKAEPARQTTTKRRKRKNSASSANSSVGTAASKKRSPATNFSLSSQVPVSISSSRFASSFIYIEPFSSHFSSKHLRKEP